MSVQELLRASAEQLSDGAFPDEFSPDVVYIKLGKACERMLKAADLIDALIKDRDEAREALDNINMYAVEGPSKDWMMIPRSEWDNIFRALLSGSGENNA